MADRSKPTRSSEELPTESPRGSTTGSESEPTFDVERSPRQIADFGGYRILEKIGEGGMGEVYRAEQVHPIRRTVALKVIKLGMDSREVVARFETERQALAMMNHSGIAKVHDAGTTPGGRPYFAMEYIQGIPVNEYCDLHRLTTRDRLRLFVKICDAVQHAHQKAILHRDLKPSNVLVTAVGETPEPKIIDFGVAKALAQRLTDKTLYTELGRLVGTPEYMSPEQAHLTGEDLDTRTDIYSLGVILYELLVGARPFDRRGLRGGLDELRRRIREDEPQRPSTRLTDIDTATTAKARRIAEHSLLRELRGDLDWITLKALDKEPGRRYSTASEFALDIERYLRDEPVAASPPSSIYKLNKFVRRHRSGVVLSAITVLALLAGLAASTFGFVTARRERDRKERALAEAEQITGFLATMLESADPTRSGRQITVPEMLDRASAKLGSTFADQPLVEARLRQTIGNTYQALGLYDRAAEELPQVTELRRSALGDEHPETLDARQALGNLRFDEGRYGDAETVFEEILEIRRRLFGETEPDTLWAQFNLANVYRAQGRLEEAETFHAEVLEAHRQRLGEDHLDTLTVMDNLASVYWEQGRLDEAAPLYRAVHAGRAGRLGRRHPKTLDVLNNLAAIDHAQGRLEVAGERYREALDAGREVRGAEHPETLITLGNLGELYGDLQQLDEAAQLLGEALDGKTRVLGPDHPSTDYTRRILARVEKLQTGGGTASPGDRG